MVEPVGRLFVGVDLPDDARAALAAAIDRWLDGRPMPGRPVPPPNWHLTMRFLGTVDQVRHERLLAALDTLDSGPPFEVRVEGIGAFPNRAKATLLWVGVTEGAEELGRLTDSVAGAVEESGFDPEDRPFRPHLTLSRIRPPQDLRAMVGDPTPVRFEVGEVTLFRTHLGPPTSYERIDRFPLGR